MNKHNSIPRAEHEAREKFKGCDPILVVSPPRVFSLVILCPHFMCARVEEKEIQIKAAQLKSPDCTEAV